MGRRNPAVGSHPDLFESSPTSVFVPLEELSEEEILGLPRSAFSDEEWEELDEDVQMQILTSGKSARSDFSEEEWDELDDSTQQEVRDQDPDSQNRMNTMIEEFVKRHEWAQEPDTDYMRESFESDFDYWFSEMGDDAVGFIEGGRSRRQKELLHDLIENFKEEGFSEEQITAAVNEAMQDRDNWEFSYGTDEYSSAFFKASANESFYMEKDELKEVTEGMYPDEIEEALKEINRKTYLNLDLNDIRKGLDKWGLEIQEYAQHYADADPDWDKITTAVEAALEDTEPEGGEKALDEERILYRFKDGGYVLDLLASELPAEGRGRGLCVGSKQFGFISAVEKGTNKIFSMRDADGEREYTMQAILKPDGSLNYIGQIKREHNNLPQVEDVEKLVLFLKEGLKLPWKKIKDIQDLKPALREAGLLKSLPAPKENPCDCHCGFCCEHQP